MKYTDEIENLKKLLIGIRINNFNIDPDFTFGRWKVYELPPNKIIVGFRRQRNYQINGTAKEKIIVRTWLSADFKSIIKIQYYYLKGTDQELANYIARALLSKISQKYPLQNWVKVVELKHK